MPLIQKIRKAVEIPQAQLTDMPVEIHDRRLGFRRAADRAAPTGPAYLEYQRDGCDATPSTNDPGSSESTTSAGGPKGAVQCQRSWISLSHRLKEKTVEVVKVIPLERAVEQIVHVTVEIPRPRVQQRTTEFEHQSRLP